MDMLIPKGSKNTVFSSSMFLKIFWLTSFLIVENYCASPHFRNKKSRDSLLNEAELKKLGNNGHLEPDVEHVAKLLRNKKFVTKQVKCIMEPETCDFIGKRIRDLLPLVITSKCTSCSPTQRQELSTLISWIKSTYPQVWTERLKKYKLLSSHRQINKSTTTLQPRGNVISSYTEKNDQPNSKENSSEQYFRSVAVIPTPMSEQNFSVDYLLGTERLKRFETISPAPEPQPSMEMPTPPMQPTTVPENWKDLSSSLIPPFASVVESTIQIKNATEKP